MYKKLNIKIGGEFDINPKSIGKDCKKELFGKEFLFSSGRSALLAILKHIIKTKPNTCIYIPYYICNSVVMACESAGFKIHFYELDNNFLFPIDLLERLGENATLLNICYFGFVNDNDLIKKIKSNRPDITTISDRVQMFWNYTDSIADFSYTSLRKHFPVPDGALVYSNKNNWNFDSKIEENNFYKDKLIGAILKNSKVDDNLYLQYFKLGEEKLDQSKSITRASELCHSLLKSVNFSEAKQRRKDNCSKIYELGSKYGLEFVFKYSEDIIPMCVPIMLKKRDEVRKKLIERNVFLPVHWPLMAQNVKSSTALLMAQNELSLIIDQRYSTEEMKFQMNCLIDCI